MNRGRSSDSLDNGDDNIICSSSGSSSPTDFTSDDEASTDNLFMMSGQPLSKPRSRATCNSNQPVKTDKYPMSSHYRPNYPLQSRHNMLQSSIRPIVGSNEHHLPSSINYIDTHSVEPAIHPSTSYYTDPTLSSSRLTSNLNALSSRLSDIASNPSSISLLPDQPFGHRCNNQIENVNSHRSIIRHRRAQSNRGGHSSNTIVDENGENVGVLMADEEDDDTNLFERADTQIEPLPSVISGSTRGLSTIAVRMCSRLVECRNLIEAIEFIEQNRDLIDDITRIITQEAPAFRNYEISNYQIDYSVKESFNPNFWQDREPVVTTADGNCQYHAVSISLTGTEAYTPEVRLATAVAVIDNREWFDSMLKLIDRGTVLDLVHTIARSYSWGDETTLKAIAVAINRRIFLYTCNIGKKDYEMVKSLSKEELLDAFKEKKYRGGTGIHTYADPLIHVSANNYIMLFHKSEHFIAVLPTTQQPTMFEPYNPIVPNFN